MNTLEFQVLGLSAKSAGFELWDDGFVPSMRAHAEKVYREVMGTDEGLQAFLETHCAGAHKGACVDFIYPTGTLYVIFYEHGANDATDTFNRAHEETHALHGTHHLELLEERLAGLGVRLDLAHYRNPAPCSHEDMEFIANIGGLYALHARGNDILAIPSEGNPPAILPALAAYQQGLRQHQAPHRKTI